MTEPRMQPDAAGYLPNGRPSTERLLADAEEQLELAEGLPDRLAAIHGWASNEPETITVTVNHLGELVDIQIAEIVLTADTRAIGNQIVRLAEQAHRAATARALDELAPVAGDEETLELARAAGLDDRIEPDAPVVDNTGDGVLTPRAAGTTGAPPPQAPLAGRQQEEEEDISLLDFSKFRSDR